MCRDESLLTFKDRVCSLVYVAGMSMDVKELPATPKVASSGAVAGRLMLLSKLFAKAMVVALVRLDTLMLVNLWTLMSRVCSNALLDKSMLLSNPP